MKTILFYCCQKVNAVHQGGSHRASSDNVEMSDLLRTSRITIRGDPVFVASLLLDVTGNCTSDCALLLSSLSLCKSAEHHLATPPVLPALAFFP